MKKYIYRVTFITKKGGLAHWSIDIEADSQKESKQIAMEMWENNSDKHAFQVESRKISDNEELTYNYFVKNV